jgi:hypothetical protein
MPLTKEQLLRKRFKFKMPYPGSHWDIGEVFELHVDGFSYKTKLSSVRILDNVIEFYPHIFQPLPWWSDREIEDLPRYIKKNDGRIFLVLHYGYSESEGELFLVMDDIEIPNYMDYLDPQPATEEEYTAYINKTTINHD